MNEKSHVSLEQHVCLVCGVTFDTGAILLDRRLRASMERHTTTVWGLCTEHRRLFKDGYIALVECDPQRSGLLAGGECLEPGQAYRTGRVAHMKREVFARTFDVTIATAQACVFVEPSVIERLQARTVRKSGKSLGGNEVRRSVESRRCTCFLARVQGGGASNKALLAGAFCRSAVSLLKRPDAYMQPHDLPDAHAIRG